MVKSVLSMHKPRALDLVVLGILKRYWFATSKGKGGRLIEGTPWTKVSAKDMAAYLQAERLEVSVKTAQRSLRRLVEMGYCRREQLGLRRWNHEAWFAPPLEGVLFGESPERTTGCSLKYSSEGISADHKVIEDPPKVSFADPSSGTPLVKGDPPERFQEGASSRTPNDPSYFCSSSYKSVYKSGEDRFECSDELATQQPVPTHSISEVLRRCQERAGPVLGWTGEVSPVSPRAVVIGGRKFQIDDGPTSPLR